MLLTGIIPDFTYVVPGTTFTYKYDEVSCESAHHFYRVTTGTTYTCHVEMSTWRCRSLFIIESLIIIICCSDALVSRNSMKGARCLPQRAATAAAAAVASLSSAATRRGAASSTAAAAADAFRALARGRRSAKRFQRDRAIPEDVLRDVLRSAAVRRLGKGEGRGTSS